MAAQITNLAADEAYLWRSLFFLSSRTETERNKSIGDFSKKPKREGEERDA